MSAVVELNVENPLMPRSLPPISDHLNQKVVFDALRSYP